MARLLDELLPATDVQSRHSIVVHAPPALVMEVARNVDLQALPLVHFLFWARGKLMHAKAPVPPRGQPLVPYTQSLGWGVLLDEPDRAYVSGAATQPWRADVVFSPLSPTRSDTPPDHVKIVWSLEAEPLGPAKTRLSTETRVAATDASARAKFRRYWMAFGVGIRLIRWLLLPAVRREAERRWRAEGGVQGAAVRADTEGGGNGGTRAETSGTR